MPVPEIIAAILSTPFEWESFSVGLMLAGLIICSTETNRGLYAAAAAFLIFAAPVLPIELLFEWPYWPAPAIALLSFGLSKLGPKNPLLIGKGSIESQDGDRVHR